MIEYLRTIAETNVKQRREEGCQAEVPTEADATELLRFIDELERAPISADFPYNEPNDLKSIRALAPEAPVDPCRPDESTIREKILGGWLGRAAGCRLGRPIEGTPLGFRKEDVRRFLQEQGLWPIDGFFHVGEPLCAYDPILPKPFPGMIRDDDIDYVMLNLLMLERFGLDWTYDNAREIWTRHLSHDFIYAAGRAAYDNFCIGLMPPLTATWGNPCRHSLGAMIRCDTWGWACPGDPVRAAELAHRDALISQTGSGIYAGMFFAAIIARAFVESDVHILIEIGLSQVPATSRFAEAVKFTVEAWDAQLSDGCKSKYDPGTLSPAAEAALDTILSRYGELYFNHSIINTCIVLIGLLSGEGDFERVIVDTVLSGFDADCTGATAGSIAGVIAGGSSIPRKWVDPLNDTYETFLAGFGVQKFTNLAERTAAIATEALDHR